MKLKLTIDLDNEIISFANPLESNVKNIMPFSTKHEINRITVQLQDTDDSLDCNETDSKSTTDEITDAGIESKLAEVDDVTDVQKNVCANLSINIGIFSVRHPGVSNLLNTSLNSRMKNHIFLSLILYL